MSLLFCEKYKPKKQNELIGNQQSIYTINDWL